METLPMPLEAMSGSPHGLGEFRVNSPAEVFSLLKQCADGNVLLSLSSPEGAAYTTTVWALDPARGLLCLSADGDDIKLQRLLESEEVVAVGYLDSVKLQFDLHDLVLVHSGRASEQMLEAARGGNWDQVVKLEGACAVLINQLKQAAATRELGADERQLKTRIMKRILVNDAEVRTLAEPWLEDLDQLLAGRPKMLH